VNNGVADENVGGLVGYGSNTLWYSCYWDIESSGQTTSVGGLGKTTVEMKQQATFVDWDFETVWGITENETYPFLRGVGGEPPPGAEATITSPLEILPRFAAYTIGEVITAQFAITNTGTEPIHFTVLTVGGRDPDGEVVDFDWEQNVTLNPDESHNYIGDLTLPNKDGTYYFFCTYQAADGNWNTSIELGPSLTDDDRAKRLAVFDATIGPPSEFLFDAVHLSARDCQELASIVKEILIAEKLKLNPGDPLLPLSNEAIVLTHRMETEQRPPRDPIREGSLTEDQDFWLSVGGEVVGFLLGIPGVGDAARLYGFDIAEALYLKHLGYVRMKQSPIGDLTITYRSDEGGALITYQGPSGGISIITRVTSEWVFFPAIRKELLLPDLQSYSIIFKPECDISARIKSVAELRIYDSEGRVTGMVGGEVREEISNSMYSEDNEAITILFASASYVYEVAGTEEGTYGLDIRFAKDGEAIAFEAIDIPTSPGVLHKYTIDWEAVAAGEEGVTVHIDTDGDGTFEGIITSDSELTSDEFNLPPFADAGPDQTVEQESYDGTEVTLDGSGSTDPDSTPGTNNDIQFFDWYEGDTLLGSGETIKYIFPLGEHIVTLVVTDFLGQADDDEVTITVVDTTSPTISSISASPDVLWPPNHRMVEVYVEIEAVDDRDPAPVCRIVEVTCNEPVNGPGDGNSEPDWEITGDLTVLLRAERDGGDTERVYTIVVACTDASGNTATDTVEVIVPHDQGKGKKK